MTKSLLALAAVLLAILAAARVASTWTIFSQTFDEFAHLQAGFELLSEHRYESDPEHPPLARVFFALDAWAHGLTKDDLLDRRDHYRRDLAGMRAGNLPFLFLGTAIVFLWSLRLFGPSQAIVAAALFTSLPTILAHSGLATTDLAATSTVAAALYALWLWCEGPSPMKAAILGVAIGVGLLCKFSFALFFGVCAIVFLIARRPRSVWHLVISAPIAAAIVWGGYGFTFGTMLESYPEHSVQRLAARYAESPGYEWVRADHIERYRRFAMQTEAATGYAGIDFVDWAKAAGHPSPLAGRAGRDTMAEAPPIPPPGLRSRLVEPIRRLQHWVAKRVPLPAPMFFVGLERLAIHSELGHPSFLLGRAGTDGWWYYFPVVLFFKTPLPFLALAIVGIVLLLKRESAIAIAPLAMFLVLLPSRINIGVRHALPIYPMLTLCAAFAAVWLWRRGRAGRTIVVGLLLWFFISAAAAHPDYLAWFNETAGSHPERIAIDSNLDWGQDQLRLKEELQRARIDKAYLALFHSDQQTLPEIPGVPLPENNRCVVGWIAISDTKRVLHRGGFRWLDGHRPVRRIGRTIRLYHVTKCP